MSPDLAIRRKYLAASRDEIKKKRVLQIVNL